MSVGLTGDDSHDEEAESDEEQDLDRLPVNPVRREDKKTITQRNKEKERKRKELKARQAKEQKLMTKDIFRYFCLLFTALKLNYFPCFLCFGCRHCLKVSFFLDKSADRTSFYDP